MLHYPRITDVPLGTGKFSFNENKAFQKLKQEFIKCDKPVREEFIERLNVHTGKANQNRHFAAQNKLSRIGISLEAIHKNSEKIRDHQALTTLKSAETMKSGLAKIRSKLFGEPAAIQRKIAAIESPSSYERHIVATEGKKVTSRPLHVEELRRREEAKVFGGQAPDSDAPELKTKGDIQSFTKKQFESFSEAIRTFQSVPLNVNNSSATEALRDAVLPILRSKDRAAVHRFVRDMTRQLKRAGVSGDEFKKLNSLIPNQPNHLLALAQSIKGGLGKQMRLQDEALRMAEALPIVLKLTAENRDVITSNLMSFNLDGPSALDASFRLDVPSEEAVKFLT
jgi:hypothetical protein